MGVYVREVTGTNNAVPFIQEGWDIVSEYAASAFAEAMNLATTTLTAPSVTTTVPGSVAIPTGISVDQAGSPAVPHLSTFTSPTYTTPSINVASYSPGAAPSFSGVAPTISFPSAPSPTSPTEPGDAPIVDDPLMPVAPTYTLPSVPTMRDIALPLAPDVIIPVFAGVSPSGDVPSLVSPNFIWVEPPYTEKLPTLAAKMAHYITFDYDAAELSIWERGQERVERATNIAVNGLMNDFAARGFSLPPGSLLAATSEARMKGAEAKYDNARDAMIKAAELNTQKLTLAIQEGIKYESMWLNYHTDYAKRSFDAAKTTVEIAFKVADLEVALFNARLQAYQTEAQVHRDLIQAELAKLEAYKAELEGLKLISQLNMQDVELYNAQLKGVITVIEAYKAEISAEVAKIDADKARVEAYVATVQAYKARIEAINVQYSAWAEQMKGEATKAQVYETEVKAFASLVGAYASETGANVEAEKLTLESDRNKIELFRSQLAEIDTLVRQYSAEIDAQTKVYDASVRGYDSTIRAREASAKTELGVASLRVEDYKARAAVTADKARVDISNADVQLKVLIAQLENAGRILSQLSASAMSAFNLSASASDSTSRSISNSLSESYSASI